MNQQELGVFGENMAANYLSKLGHKILQRNWKFLKWELDILTRFEDKIHITEVKTRQTAEIGEPWRAVTKAKQNVIIKAADQYLKQNHIENEAQFNVISIVHNQFRTDLEYIPDAFTP
jgi:putative endonuclease